MKSLSLFQILSITLILVQAPCHGATLANPPSGLDFGDLQVAWTRNPSGNLDITVTGKTTGWVGIGFSNDQSMLNSDVILGGVGCCNQNYLYDAWAGDHAPPAVDTQNDLTLLSASETNGTTQIRFERPLATGDGNDLDLTQGPVYLLWALGPEDITDPTQAAYHLSNRGVSAGKIDFKVSAVPLPGAVWLFGPALSGLGIWLRKKGNVTGDAANPAAAG